MTDINKKILTLSIVLGDTCNADCKFCISKLTFNSSIKKCKHWWSKLRKACRVAQIGGADTVIITSKREPTMADTNELLEVIKICDEYFPIIELQTNGIKLSSWQFVDLLGSSGLTTICISCASTYEQKINQSIMSENYPDLKETVSLCKSKGFLTRACVIMTQGVFGVGDNKDALSKQIDGAKNNGFDQVTLRIMGAPDVSLTQEIKKADKVVKWIQGNKLSTLAMHHIKTQLDKYPLLRRFPWGSEVRSVNGTSVCLADCLSEEIGNDHRYVIYFPDGHLRYRWEVPEALIF